MANGLEQQQAMSMLEAPVAQPANALSRMMIQGAASAFEIDPVTLERTGQRKERVAKVIASGNFRIADGTIIPTASPTEIAAAPVETVGTVAPSAPTVETVALSEAMAVSPLVAEDTQTA